MDRDVVLRCAAVVADVPDEIVPRNRIVPALEDRRAIAEDRAVRDLERRVREDVVADPDRDAARIADHDLVRKRVREDRVAGKDDRRPVSYGERPGDRLGGLRTGEVERRAGGRGERTCDGSRSGEAEDAADVHAVRRGPGLPVRDQGLLARIDDDLLVLGEIVVARAGADHDAHRLRHVNGAGEFRRILEDEIRSLRLAGDFRERACAGELRKRAVRIPALC